MAQTENDKILCKISKRTLILHKLKPINLRHQRKLFFDSDKYNPVFKYHKWKRKFNSSKKTLSGLEFDSSAIGVLLLKKRAELKRRIELIESIGTDDFTNESIKLFGRPNKYLVRTAKSELESYQKIKEGMKMSFDEAKVVINKVLSKYNLDQWTVTQKHLVADCARSENKLFLRHGVHFSKERLRKTIAHEIETHILRSENAKLQPYEIFRIGTAGYDFTEEGLAIYNENLVSDKQDEKKFWPGAYLIAVDKAMTSSFREVYDLMRWYRFTKLRSWVIATKVKRGLVDTSKPGGYTKDYMYYAGKYMIENFISKGGDISELYLGKIGINDLRYAREIEGLKKAKYLPKFYLKK